MTDFFLNKPFYTTEELQQVIEFNKVLNMFKIKNMELLEAFNYNKNLYNKLYKCIGSKHPKFNVDMNAININALISMNINPQYDNISEILLKLSIAYMERLTINNNLVDLITEMTQRLKHNSK